MRSTCYVPSVNFFLGAVSDIQRSKVFTVFPTWLLHQVTEDVIIINKTFFMSSRTDGENSVSIRQAVVEKNTKVLCRRTNKQTKKNKKKTSCGARYLQNPPPLQKLPRIHQIVHFIKIKIDNLHQI